MSFPWSPTSTCRRLRCSCYNQKQHELLGTDIHVAHPGFFPQERLTDEGGGYFCQKYWPTGNKDFCHFLHICLSKSQKIQHSSSVVEPEPSGAAAFMRSRKQFFLSGAAFIRLLRLHLLGKLKRKALFLCQTCLKINL